MTPEGLALEKRLQYAAQPVCKECGCGSWNHAFNCETGIRFDAEFQDGRTRGEKIAYAEKLATLLAELWGDPWNEGSQHQRAVADYLRESGVDNAKRFG